LNMLPARVFVKTFLLVTTKKKSCML
jgi:hypothetical protein